MTTDEEAATNITKAIALMSSYYHQRAINPRLETNIPNNEVIPTLNGLIQLSGYLLTTLAEGMHDVEGNTATELDVLKIVMSNVS